MSTRLLRIHGRVQGVGFRHSLLLQARRAELAGWVRNRIDGTVEALLQGPASAVAAVEAWAQAGPPGAWVERVEGQAAPEETVAGFEQRPTA